MATTVLFDEAREDARALDEEYATTGKIRGPLHGVPVSFKDQCTPSAWPSSSYCLGRRLTMLRKMISRA